MPGLMGDANPVLSCNIALQEAVDYASHPERVTPSQFQPAVHVHRCCPACRGRALNQASRASYNGLSSSFSHLLSTEASGMLPAAARRHQQATTPCLPLVETFDALPGEAEESTRLDGAGDNGLSSSLAHLLLSKPSGMLSAAAQGTTVWQRRPVCHPLRLSCTACRGRGHYQAGWGRQR